MVWGWWGTDGNEATRGLVFDFGVVEKCALPVGAEEVLECVERDIANSKQGREG